MIFNLLCAPCFAAMGAIKREMNNWKWTLGAIGYMCGLAYVVSFIVYQIGSLFVGGGFGIGTVIAIPGRHRHHLPAGAAEQVRRQPPAQRQRCARFRKLSSAQCQRSQVAAGDPAGQDAHAALGRRSLWGTAGKRPALGFGRDK